MGCWNPFLDSHGQQVKSGASASAALDKIDIAAWSHTAMVGGTVCNIESLDPIEVWKCPHWKNQGRDGFSKVFHRSVFFLKDDAELIMMGWIIWDDTWDSIWDAQRVISAIHWAFIRNPLTFSTAWASNLLPCRWRRWKCPRASKGLLLFQTWQQEQASEVARKNIAQRLESRCMVGFISPYLPWIPIIS